MPGRKNKLSDLRDHLFACLEDLNDPEKDLDEAIKRSRAVADVSRAVIETAKVEVNMVQALTNSGHDPSTFFDENRDRLLPEAKNEKPDGNPAVVRPPLPIAGGRS